MMPRFKDEKYLQGEGERLPGVDPKSFSSLKGIKIFVIVLQIRTGVSSSYVIILI